MLDWSFSRRFLKNLGKVGLGGEAEHVGNLGDGAAGGFQQGFGLLDSFLEEIIDGRQSCVLCEGVGQIVFVHMSQGRQGIQRDILRIICIQEIFDLGTFPG